MSPLLSNGLNETYQNLKSEDWYDKNEYVTISIETQSSVVNDSRDVVRGYSLVALSAVIFSFNTLFTKFASESGIPIFHLLSARGVIQLIVTVVILVLKGVHPLRLAVKHTKAEPYLHLHGITCLIGIACLFYGLTKLIMSDATIFFFTSPVYTSIFAWFFLSEPISLKTIFAFFIAMTGVILTARPAFMFPSSQSPPLDILAVIITNIGAVFMAVCYICVRIANRSFGVEPCTFVLYSSTYCALFPAYLAVLFEHQFVNFSVSNVFCLIGVGMCSSVGQFLLNWGFQLAPVGPASLIRNLDIAIIFFMDLVLHDFKVFQLTSLIGAILVLSASALVVCRRK